MTNQEAKTADQQTITRAQTIERTRRETTNPFGGTRK
jgi:hypothetical protein